MMPTLPLMRLTPGLTERAFEPVRLLAAKLYIAAQRIAPLAVDAPAWRALWALAAQFEACDLSVRRLTGWTRCAFGPDRNCPTRLPVKCAFCTNQLNEHPRYDPVTTTVETDADGNKVIIDEWRIPPFSEDPWRALIDADATIHTPKQDGAV